MWPFLSHGTLKSAVSQEWMDELSWFLDVHTYSGKLKITLIVIGWAWSNMGVGFGLLAHGTLKSAVFQEWIDELSWLFACWYVIRKAKSYCNKYWVHRVKYGCELLGRGNIKSALSQE